MEKTHHTNAEKNKIQKQLKITFTLHLGRKKFAYLHQMIENRHKTFKFWLC